MPCRGYGLSAGVIAVTGLLRCGQPTTASIAMRAALDMPPGPDNPAVGGISGATFGSVPIWLPLGLIGIGMVWLPALLMLLTGRNTRR